MKLIFGNYFVFLTLFIIFNGAYAQEKTTDINHEILTLNKELSSITDNLYQLNVIKSPLSCKNIKSIENLIKNIQSLSHDMPIAISCIVENIDLLHRSIDHKSIPDIAWFLYKNNAISIADELLAFSINNFSKYTESKIKYQKAKYYFLNNHWVNVINLLKETNIEHNLNQEESDYAYYITAVSLQKIQQHRDAIKVYSAIDKNSDYYSVSQINIAVANILQGWWTDAHLILKKSITREMKNKNYEIADRMRLILGFSQIQNEFYRDARNSFRDIGVNSPYVNRAMLGIGLSAMHQKDFSSALNAFSFLSKNKIFDSYTTQSYLLTPFAHEKLGQRRIAEAQYTQAALYYRQKIQLLEQAVSTKKSQYSPLILKTITDITQESDNQESLISILNLTDTNFNKKINSILKNIESLKKYSLPKKILLHLNTIYQKYENILLEVQHHEIVNAQAIYQSYLNQCQYALARLYDEN